MIQQFHSWVYMCKYEFSFSLSLSLSCTLSLSLSHTHMFPRAMTDPSYQKWKCYLHFQQIIPKPNLLSFIDCILAHIWIEFSFMNPKATICQISNYHIYGDKSLRGKKPRHGVNWQWATGMPTYSHSGNNTKEKVIDLGDCVTHPFWHIPQHHRHPFCHLSKCFLNGAKETVFGSL